MAWRTLVDPPSFGANATVRRPNNGASRRARHGRASPNPQAMLPNSIAGAQRPTMARKTAKNTKYGRPRIAKAFDQQLWVRKRKCAQQREDKHKHKSAEQYRRHLFLAHPRTDAALRRPSDSIIPQREAAAGRIDRCRRQKIAKLPRRTGIEARINAMGEPCISPKTAAAVGFVALVKHEGGDARAMRVYAASVAAASELSSKQSPI